MYPRSPLRAVGLEPFQATRSPKSATGALETRRSPRLIHSPFMHAPNFGGAYNENDSRGGGDDSDVQLSHINDDSPRGRRDTGRHTASPGELAALFSMLDDEGPAAFEALGRAPIVLPDTPIHFRGLLAVDATGGAAASIAQPPLALHETHEASGMLVDDSTVTAASQPVAFAATFAAASAAARTGPAHRLRTPGRSILMTSTSSFQQSALRSGRGVGGPAASVVFVSPQAAEFEAEAPPSAMVVRMGRSEAKARFRVNGSDDEEAGGAASASVATATASAAAPESMPRFPDLGATTDGPTSAPTLAAAEKEEAAGGAESMETSFNSSVLDAWEPAVSRLESSAVSKKRARQQRRASSNAKGAAQSADDEEVGSTAAETPAELKRSRRDSLIPSHAALAAVRAELIEEELGEASIEDADAPSSQQTAGAPCFPIVCAPSTATEQAQASCSDQQAMMAETQPLVECTASSEVNNAVPAPAKRLPRPPPPRATAAQTAPPPLLLPPKSTALGLSRSPAPASLATRRGAAAAAALASSAGGSSIDLPVPQSLHQRRITIGVFSFATQQQQQQQQPIAPIPAVPEEEDADEVDSIASPPSLPSAVIRVPQYIATAPPVPAASADDTASSLAVAELFSLLGNSMDDSTAAAAGTVEFMPPLAASVATQSPPTSILPTQARKTASPAPPLTVTPSRRRRASSSRGATPVPPSPFPAPQRRTTPRRQSSVMQDASSAGTATASGSSTPASTDNDAWRPRRAGTPGALRSSQKAAAALEEEEEAAAAAADVSAIELSGSIVFGLPPALAGAVLQQQHGGGGNSRLMMQSPLDFGAGSNDDMTAELPLSIVALQQEEAMAAAAIASTSTLSAAPRMPATLADLIASEGTSSGGGNQSLWEHSMLGDDDTAQSQLPTPCSPSPRAPSAASRASGGATPIHHLLGRLSALRQSQQQQRQVLVDDEDVTALLPLGLGALLAQETVSGEGFMSMADTDIEAADDADAEEENEEAAAAMMAETRLLESCGLTPNRALQRLDRAAAASDEIDEVAVELQRMDEAAGIAAAAAAAMLAVAAVQPAPPVAIAQTARAFMAQLASASMHAAPAPLLIAGGDRAASCAPFAPMAMPLPGAEVWAPAQRLQQTQAAAYVPTQEALTQPMAMEDDAEEEEEESEVDAAPVAAATAATPVRTRLMRAVARTATKPARQQQQHKQQQPSIAAPAAPSATFQTLPLPPPAVALRALSVAPSHWGNTAEERAAAVATAAVLFRNNAHAAPLTLGHLCSALSILPTNTAAARPSAARDLLDPDFATSTTPVPSSAAAAAVFHQAFTAPYAALREWTARALRGQLSDVAGASGHGAMLSAPLGTPPPFLITALTRALATLHAAAASGTTLAQQPTPALVNESLHLLARVHALHSGLAAGAEAAYLQWRTQVWTALSAELASSITRLQGQEATGLALTGRLTSLGDAVHTATAAAAHTERVKAGLAAVAVQLRTTVAAAASANAKAAAAAAALESATATTASLQARRNELLRILGDNKAAAAASAAAAEEAVTAEGDRQRSGAPDPTLAAATDAARSALERYTGACTALGWTVARVSPEQVALTYTHPAIGASSSSRSSTVSTAALSTEVVIVRATGAVISASTTGAPAYGSAGDYGATEYYASVVASVTAHTLAGAEPSESCVQRPLARATSTFRAAAEVCAGVGMARAASNGIGVRIVQAAGATAQWAVALDMSSPSSSSSSSSSAVPVLPAKLRVLLRLPVPHSDEAAGLTAAASAAWPVEVRWVCGPTELAGPAAEAARARVAQAWKGGKGRAAAPVGALSAEAVAAMLAAVRVAVVIAISGSGR